MVRDSEMGILRRTERSMVRLMCGEQHKTEKDSTNLMFMLGLNETIVQLAIANSVCWQSAVEERELSCLEKGTRSCG